MFATYIALVYREDKMHVYGVIFPDFPGCVSAGTTIEQALDNAQKGLQFHIEGMLNIGEGLPRASSKAKIMADPENRVASPYEVNVEVPGGGSSSSQRTLHHGLL